MDLPLELLGEVSDRIGYEYQRAERERRPLSTYGIAKALWEGGFLRDPVPPSAEENVPNSSTPKEHPIMIDEALRTRLIEEGWTSPPRVFLAGAEIPSHLPVINEHGEVHDDYQDYDKGDGEVYTANYDVVEMNIDWEAARKRARRDQAGTR